MNRSLSFSSDTSKSSSPHDDAGNSLYDDAASSDTERISNIFGSGATDSSNTTSTHREALAEPGAGIFAADDSDSDLLFDGQDIAHHPDQQQLQLQQHDDDDSDDCPFLGDIVEPKAAAVVYADAGGKAPIAATAAAAMAAFNAAGSSSKIRGEPLVHGSTKPNVSITESFKYAANNNHDVEAAAVGAPAEAAAAAEPSCGAPETAATTAKTNKTPAATPRTTSPLTDGQRKRRFCICIAILLGIILIAIGTALGLRNKRGGKSSASTDTSQSSNSSSPTAGNGSPEPIVYNPTTTAIKCFETTEELYEAVDAYLARLVAPSDNGDDDTLAATYGQSMNDWCVGNLTRFDFVFAVSRSPNSRLFNEPLDQWNMNNAESLAFMFAGAASLDQSLSAWDTSKVRNMSHTFADCRSYNQPLQTWDVSSVTTMSNMFEHAKSFDQPLNAWNSSACDNFARMFYNATSFAQTLCNWRELLKPDANVSQMFGGASSCPVPSTTPSLVSGRHFCTSCAVDGTDREPPRLPGVQVPIELNTNNGTV